MMKNMRLCGLFWLLVCCSYADDLRELERRGARREQLTTGYQFVYRLEYRVEWLDGQEHSFKGENFIVRVYRGQNRVTRVVVSPVSGNLISTDLARQVKVNPDNGVSGWEMWFGDRWSIYIDSVFGASLEEIQEVATIYPTPGNSVYYFTKFSPLIYQMDPVDNILLSNSNILKIMQTKWNKVHKLSDRWLLQGEYMGRFTRGNIAVELALDDALPLQIMTTQRDGRFRWVVRQNTVLNGVRVPKVIDVEKRLRFVVDHVRITLIDVLRIEDEKVTTFDPPIGLQINDYRLVEYEKILQSDIRQLTDQVVSYRWQGKFYSPEELKQLAYQQGNLVPPETPRRRYSLWLFVPAALFFLAAAYLYLKGKRR